MWLGITMNSSNRWFQVPDYYEKFHKEEDGKKYAFVPGVMWFTNLTHSKRNEELILYKKYNQIEYPKFDNYDAINVNKVKEIPKDYEGKIGVPISFIQKYNPQQFEIIDALNRYSILEGPTEKTRGKYLSQVNGKPIYVRIIVRKKNI